MRIVTALNTRALHNGLRLTDSEFTPAHVQALQRQIAKWAPDATFECLSNIDVPGVKTLPYKYDWPGWWIKLGLYDPEISGDFLFMDLDTIITGPLDDILAVRDLTFLRDFYRDGKKLKAGLGGGLIYLPEGKDRRLVWDFWITNPALFQKLYPRGDQHLFERFFLNSCAKWQDVVPNQVVSWKVHCANGVPPDARILCFHGVPRPWAVGQFLHLYR